jgi:phosphoribosylformylglycinamidine synthase subunit PurQ / glutaminase
LKWNFAGRDMKTLILRAPGINRDYDVAQAITLAGGTPELVHVNRVAAGEVRLRDYGLLVIPGGFSYGDHLGAGKLLAVDLIHRLGEQLHAFVADARPVIGICNGFQVLVKAGVLPGEDERPKTKDEGTTGLPKRPSSFVLRPSSVTLTDNASARFECRWVHLAADPTSMCVFTKGIERPIEVPVAHGEGRLFAIDTAAEEGLRKQRQVALRYVDPTGNAAAYPANPNGSFDSIAGICNPQGNVLGLMPHPENAVRPQQHPRWTREAPRSEGDGLVIFRNAVRYAMSM